MGQVNTAELRENNALYYMEFRPDLDFETIRGNAGIPTLVTRGIFRGFSLPVYAANNEELFLSICVPSRWNGASNIYTHLYCWLSQAENNKNFKLQLSWEHYTAGADVIPNTSTDIEVQTPTGAAAQFQSYKVEFTIPFGDLATDDILTMRLRRIAADADECVGEIVISHHGVIFGENVLGLNTP